MKPLTYITVFFLLSLSGCLKDNPTVEELMKDKKLMMRVKNECHKMGLEESQKEDKCKNLEIAIEESLKENPI